MHILKADIFTLEKPDISILELHKNELPFFTDDLEPIFASAFDDAESCLVIRV
uniref:TRAP-type C4-dicarboxylate transport system n=1 Tax=Acinetobacter baumannii TaxID=470 RepID=A0A125S0U2_ACIBA|nr:TRAP-type C4-dicarboxylate transport system [Acinetobacter baumannii]